MRRGFPWTLCAALLFCLCVGLWLAHAAPRYVDGYTLVYREKLRRATEGPGVDVMILGASQTAAAIQPAILAESLPPGTRVYNYAAAAMSPAGGEVLLRRYLAGHEPPRLLLLSYSPIMYGDRRSEFERYTLKETLGLREVVLAAWADRRPGYLLGWLATRLGTVRYREGLRTALGAALLDRVPALRPRVFDWLGLPEHPLGEYRFDFHYRNRALRNANLRAELEADGGWRHWKETAKGGTPRRGAVGWKFREGGLPVDSSVRSPREWNAVLRTLELCARHDIAVHVPTLPYPQWFVRALRTGERGRALDALWSDLAAQPGVTVGPTPVRPYPPELFSDPIHLGPEGAARFSREIAGVVARGYARE